LYRCTGCTYLGLKHNFFSFSNIKIDEEEDEEAVIERRRKEREELLKRLGAVSEDSNPPLNSGINFLLTYITTT